MTTLIAKQEKKMKKVQKSQQVKKPRVVVTAPHDCSDEDDTTMGVVQLDDSSEYSEEEVEDLDAPYPFQEKAPAEEDFVLVKLEQEEGRQAGSKVHYVAKIISLEKNHFNVRISE